MLKLTVEQLLTSNNYYLRELAKIIDPQKYQFVDQLDSKNKLFNTIFLRTATYVLRIGIFAQANPIFDLTIVTNNTAYYYSCNDIETVNQILNNPFQKSKEILYNDYILHLIWNRYKPNLS